MGQNYLFEHFSCQNSGVKHAHLRSLQLFLSPFNPRNFSIQFVMLSLVIGLEVGILVAVFHRVTEFLTSITPENEGSLGRNCLALLFLDVCHVFLNLAAKTSFAFLAAAPEHITAPLTFMGPTRPVEVVVRVELLMAVPADNLGDIGGVSTADSLHFVYQHLFPQNMAKYPIFNVLLLVA